MAFVQLSSISVAFGDRDILSGVTLNLNSTSRTALSGSNGSGKSTLMKIIAGITQPDRGTVTSQQGIRVGYLPQDGLTYGGNTLQEEADSAFTYLHRIHKKMEETAEMLQVHSEEGRKTEILLHQHHELHEALLSGGYYNRTEKIDQILTGLGFSRKDFGMNCSSFSGGWQMRIALAKILLSSPDIILLDEPTNYLDLEARNWLEGFLKEFNGGVLVVSHDRYFLDVTVTEVIELFTGSLKRYKGNYSHYEKVRKEELKTLLEQYKRQQEEIVKLEDFINKFRYNASKASLVQSKIKYLEKLERIEIPESLKKIHFTFPQPPHSGKEVLTIKDLYKAYGTNVIFDGFSTQFASGEKVVITGVNGAGKTTLLRIIAGVDSDYMGTVAFGTGVKTGYFSQDINRFKDQNHSILEELESIAPTHLIPHLRSMLGAFLFRGDDIYKSLAILSGGEKSRLALLELLLFPVNLLVLDEPTNHLDIHSKDILLNALKSYSGTLIFVSHDRYFIENIAERVIDLGATGPQDYPGDYSYFLWKKEQNAGEAPVKTESSKTREVSRGKKTHIEQKQIKNRINKLKSEELKLLEELEYLDKRYSEKEQALSLKENYSDGKKARKLKQEMDEILLLQDEVTLRWEETDNELKRLEKDE